MKTDCCSIQSCLRMAIHSPPSSTNFLVLVFSLSERVLFLLALLGPPPPLSPCKDTSSCWKFVVESKNVSIVVRRFLVASLNYFFPPSLFVLFCRESLIGSVDVVIRVLVSTS